MGLACVDSANYMIDIEVSFRGSVQSGGAKFEWIYVYCTLFRSTEFCPTGFYRKGFNETVLNTSTPLDPEDHCIYFAKVFCPTGFSLAN